MIDVLSTWTVQLPYLTRIVTSQTDASAIAGIMKKTEIVKQVSIFQLSLDTEHRFKGEERVIIRWK